MTENPKTKKKKQPYQKPELEEVELVAEEAVLGNCKQIPGGSLGSPCGGVGNPLLTQGS